MSNQKDKIIAERAGFFGIGLHQPLHDANVGSVLRLCGVFNSALLATSGRRYHRHRTDTGKEYRSTPFLQVDDLLSVIPYGCVPVGVDIIPGATPLPEYEHRDRAFYIFGPEDGTLGDSILDHCPDKIYIPSQYCLNLATTVGVICYSRMEQFYKNGSLRTFTLENTTNENTLEMSTPGMLVEEN